jgi:hypothetical protein
MKNLGKVILGIAVFASALTVTSCKGKEKKNPTPKGEIEVIVPCSGAEYFSDKKHFRANSVGESMDQATAKKKALANAKADLAGFVSTTIKATIDNYVNSREFNNKEQVEEKFEGLSREVINQELSGTKVICEKLMKDTQTGNYKHYLALELGADDLVEAINERLTKEEALRVDYDYENFKKTFEAEMEKLEKKGY